MDSPDEENDGAGDFCKRKAQFFHPVTLAEKFLAAVRDGDFQYVRSVLLGEGEEHIPDIINTRDPWNRTPFTMAVRSGDLCE